MYAVIETGGKQYRVAKGDVIDVEFALTTGKKTEKVEFDRVLMLGDGDQVKVGSPAIEGASVKGTLLDRVRGPKVKVFKFKRRKGYRRHQGHRQNYLRVQIDSIQS